MVNFAGNLNFLQASCCNVEVVKGGKGFLAVSFFSTLPTLYSAPSSSLTICPASFSFLTAILSKTSPSFLASIASNSLSLRNMAEIVQYSSALNFSISLSRSTTSLTATDCTLPAERPLATFFHKNGDNLY